MPTKTQMGRLEIPAMGICFHHYYAAKMNQREQLRKIRDLGFEVINTEESPVEPATPPGPLPAVMAWNHIEIGQNKYDWSFHDHLVEDCAEVGLKLITDVFVPFHLPDWVAEKYGDTDFIQPGGRRWGHYQRPFAGTMYEMRNFSFAHEGAAAAAADFMHKLAERYEGSETVVGHNLFQELGMNYPHSMTWYGQDVSPPAIRGFEKFLRGATKRSTVSIASGARPTAVSPRPPATRTSSAGRARRIAPGRCGWSIAPTTAPNSSAACTRPSNPPTPRPSRRFRRLPPAACTALCKGPRPNRWVSWI